MRKAGARSDDQAAGGAIVTAPTTALPVKIYVGQSAHTDRLGVTAEGLRDGAYRIVSGPNWLVLIGRDFDFDFKKLPWPLSRKDVDRARAEWDKAIAGKGFAGEILLPAAFPVSLPVIVNNLNDRWTAVLYDRAGNMTAVALSTSGITFTSTSLKP